MNTNHRFGPQGVEVAALIRRAAVITAEEADQLSLAWDAWDAAWDATWNTARDSKSWAQWDAARDAAWNAANKAAWDAEWAAAALSVRHLIGDYGFTQQHYDLLTGPWRQTIGPIHPDDIEETA